MNQEEARKVLKKLGYKEGMESVLCNLPEDIGAALKDAMDNPSGELGKYDFCMFFIKDLEELRKHAEQLAMIHDRNARLWVCYPKKTSKKYRTELSRDILWGEFGSFGFEPVSQFAIDEDWSAMRYRPVDEIGKMTRKVFSTTEGKEKA